MAKKAKNNRGYVGMFGRRSKATVWISGFVDAREYRQARQRLIELYRTVYGRAPTRVTKTDVIEFAMLGTNPGTSAFDRLVAVKVAALRD